VRQWLPPNWVPRIPHSGRYGGRVLRAAAVVLLGCIALVAGASSAAAGPIWTGMVVEPTGRAFDAPEAAGLAFRRIHGAGISYVRILVPWASVAVSQPVNASDPADSAYDWTFVDNRITGARTHHLEPILSVQGPAPAWASAPGPNGEPAGTYGVDAAAYGEFAGAVAHRYDGTLGPLTRVRYFQAWNEPNISLFLTPQLVGGRPTAVNTYRRMLEAFSTAVWAAAPDDRVVAGGLAPFRDITPSVLAQRRDWGPMSFMRALLCLSPSLKPTCSARVPFDIWSMHPYTSGGPTHRAVLPDDVSIGDLSKVRRVLQAARRYGHLRSHGPLRFWVTEFSWDSRPPDPQGVPIPLLTRWVAEALYRFWQNNVSMVTWLTIEDQPLATSYYQSGLYFRRSSFGLDKPKPILQAFRFPVVAMPGAGGVRVWGRLPWGAPGRAVVELSRGAGWRRMSVVRTDRYGVFSQTYPLAPAGRIRAEVQGTGERSVPFAVPPVPDHFYNPFGLPTLLEPGKHGRPFR